MDLLLYKLYVVIIGLAVELALTGWHIEPTYGRHGMLRKSYLQEHRKANIKYLLQRKTCRAFEIKIDAEQGDRRRTISKTDDGEKKGLQRN